VSSLYSLGRIIPVSLLYNRPILFPLLLHRDFELTRVEVTTRKQTAAHDCFQIPAVYEIFVPNS